MSTTFKDLDSLRSVEELTAYDDELATRAIELNAEAVGLPFNDEQDAEFRAIVETRPKITERVNQFQAREAYIASISQSERHIERTAYAIPNVVKQRDNLFDMAAYRQEAGNVAELPAKYRDGAMRVVEKMQFPLAADAAAADKARTDLERIINKHGNENYGWVSQHIIGTSDPVYLDAWADAFKGRGLTGRKLAVMQTYSDTDGGLSIPVAIDPTFINVSDGSVNPLRRIGRNVTTTGKTWSAITTAGVTAAYVGERTTTGASDGAPSDLDDPTVTPVRADVSIDLSLEYLQDYGSAALLSEVGGLISAAKDDLEADKFITGDGSGEPEGIVAAIVTDTTSLVTTTTNDAFLLADIDKLIGALPPRFRARAQFIANHAILQKVPNFGVAGQDAGSIYDALSSRLRGYPVSEASAMDDVTTDAKHVLLFGDFNQFAIVDRLGLTTRTLDTVDSGGRPTGGTTIYAAWRNSTKVLAFNAFRLLEID